MSVEGALVTILMVFVMSALVAILVQGWLQLFILRFIGFSTFFALTFMSAKVGKGTFYDGEFLASSMADILVGFYDNDERQIFTVVVAVMAGFVAALRKIDD